jgi:mono/diheme cytochrome c family protein
LYDSRQFTKGKYLGKIMNFKFKVLILICLGGLISGGFFLPVAPADEKDDSIKRGEQVYLTYCMSCHMYGGEGISGLYPPLAATTYVLENIPRSINVILNGQKGEIEVNGVKYNTEMPAQGYLTDRQIADVLNYVLNSWGSKGDMVTEGQVKVERDRTRE